MAEPSQHKPILTAQALDDLPKAKRQILDTVASRLSERLVLATAVAAVRLAHRDAALPAVLSERVAELVRATLMDLAQQKWKPDTALKLQRPAPGGSHGLPE
jgi:hypothetical protein